MNTVASEPGPTRHPISLEAAMGPVVLVPEDTPLRDVASLMLERQVESVVVVDSTGAVRGVVADRDLTLNQRHLQDCAIKVPRLNGHWVTTDDEIDAACLAAEMMTAREVMGCITTAALLEPLGTVVDRMLQQDAECALVVADGSVVGVLGRRHLLRLVAGQPEAHSVPAVANGTPALRMAHVTHHGRPGLGWLLRGWT